MIIHRETEQHREEKERQPRLDGRRVLKPHDRMAPALLKHGHQTAIRRPDGQQIEHHGFEGEHHGAKHEQEEHETQAQHTEDHPTRATGGAPGFASGEKWSWGAAAPPTNTATGAVAKAWGI